METAYIVTVEFTTASPFHTVKKFMLPNKAEAEKLRGIIMHGKGRVVYVEPINVVTADEAAELIVSEAKDWIKAMGGL